MFSHTVAKITKDFCTILTLRYSAEYLQVQIIQFREDKSRALDLIETFKSLKEDTEEHLVVEAIRAHGLVREHIPSEHLNSVPVWEALLDKMPMTALIRNLGKMQAIDVIKGSVKDVYRKYTNRTLPP